MFITRESGTADPLPSKATVCSPKHTQIVQRHFFGHFQDECEGEEGAEEHGLSVILESLEIIFEPSKYFN